MEVDKEFPKRWPFGLLMTAQWVGCLILLITLYCLPFYFSGTSLVFICAWTVFLVGLMIWLAHLFGLQRQTFTGGQVAIFIPFAMVLFFYSLIFFFLFCISALICFISMFSSFGYTFGLVFGYLIATILCLCNAAVCGYLAILLYRATPNGLLMNLKTVVIEGDKTSSFAVSTVPPSGVPPQTTATTGIYPQGTNPV